MIRYSSLHAYEDSLLVGAIDRVNRRRGGTVRPGDEWNGRRPCPSCVHDSPPGRVIDWLSAIHVSDEHCQDSVRAFACDTVQIILASAQPKLDLK